MCAQLRLTFCDLKDCSLPGSSLSEILQTRILERIAIPFGEGEGNPLQDSCLENPMDGEPGKIQSMGLQRVRHD